MCLVIEWVGWLERLKEWALLLDSSLDRLLMRMDKLGQLLEQALLG